LLLAGTFGSYGLVRKLAPVGPLVGTFVETVMLGPIALAVILSPGGWAASTQSGGTVALLLSAGLITAIPLLLFTTAAKRLRLSTLGFCQYVGPSCQLLMAVAYGERFRAPHWIGFELVWAGLAVYSAGLVMASGARAEEVVPVTD
jgi:chloramphenicol-sensitive protein RarD